MTAFHKQSRIMVYKSDLNYSTEVFVTLSLRAGVFSSSGGTHYWNCSGRVCLALGVAHQATDPACQSLDEGVAGVAFAVEPFDLQQLPL